MARCCDICDARDTPENEVLTPKMEDDAFIAQWIIVRGQQVYVEMKAPRQDVCCACAKLILTAHWKP